MVTHMINFIQLHDKKLGIETNMNLKDAMQSRELTNKPITTSYSDYLLVVDPTQFPLKWTRECERVKGAQDIGARFQK
jgi:hypothetical protein